MFSIHSNHIFINEVQFQELWAIFNQIIINEVQYSRIMVHIQSFNAFFNCKTLHTIIVN
jgi:hypothetical protein